MTVLTVIALLLAIDALLHFVVVARYGTAENKPVLIFGFIYSALAAAVWFSVSYAVVATLVFTSIGFLGLSLTFRSIDRNRSLDSLIWVVDAAVLVLTLSVLLGA